MKFYKLIAVILVLVVASSQLESCISRIARSEYEFLYDTSEITSVEIVEAYTDYSLDCVRVQNLLVKIEDKDDFLKKINEIYYTDVVFGTYINGIVNSTVAVKVKYSNGDYELFRSAARAVCQNGNYDEYAWIGQFDSEQFKEFIMYYLATATDPVYYYIHDKSRIISVEIVTEDYKENPENSIVVENYNEFLSEFESLSYVYTNEKLYDGNYVENFDYAIKINYDNGDYELVISTAREQYLTYENLGLRNAYMGTFDATEFDALIGKYAPGK